MSYYVYALLEKHFFTMSILKRFYKTVLEYAVMTIL